VPLAIYNITTKTVKQFINLRPDWTNDNFRVSDVEVEVDSKNSIYHFRISNIEQSYKVVKLDRTSGSAPYTLAWGKHIDNPGSSNLLFIPSKIMIN
jgi:hypothetical protein